MILSEIKTKIGRRVADPQLDTYSNEARDYFEQAFVTLLKKRDENSLLPIYEDEITPLLSFKNLSGHTNDGLVDLEISGIKNLLYVYNVVTPATSMVNYKYATMNEINDMAVNPNLQPSTKEGFWSKLGKRIRILDLINETVNVQIALVNNPNVSEWNENTSFSNYGLGFIYDAIELASLMLKKQIGIEG